MSHVRSLWSDCRWVVFDAVGTLIEPDPPVAVAYQAAGQRHGSRLTVAEIGPRFRAAYRTSESDGFPGGPDRPGWNTSGAIEAARWKWIVQTVLPDVSDHQACFHELWAHFAQPASWRCFGDVAGSLDQLKAAGFRLAVASNFDERLHGVCTALAELRPIQHRIVSASVGARKPSPAFYAAIAAACQCEPRQILMTGDHLEYDVQAPRAAGFQAIHLDRTAAASSPDRITTLAELVQRLCRP